MNPKDVTRNNLTEYAGYLIEEFYKNNLSPYYEALDDDVVWTGPMHNQMICGRANVIDNFEPEKNILSYSLGPVYSRFISMGKTHGETLSFFDRTATYPNGSTSEFHVLFHLSWVKREVWKIEVISISVRPEMDSRDIIYPLHTQIYFESNFSDKTNSNRLILREKDKNSTLFISPYEIQWVEGSGHYSTIYFASASVTVKASINEIADMANGILIKVHSGYIVNPEYVRSIKRFSITLINNKKIPVPEKKYTEIKELLSEY